MNVYIELENHLKFSKTEERQQIILDIDDTLIDCRHRKHKVFCDFLSQEATTRKFPEESRLLSELRWENVCYRIDDNLEKVGIKNPAFATSLFEFWKQHYFTYPYLIEDKAFPGAVNFVLKCQSLGLHIVYLTGRDTKGMEQGTIESFQRLGFPVGGSGISFYLKPDIALNDLEFKISSLDQIDKEGSIVAALENELPNLNAMAERFTNALMYWRPTLYAPNPPIPHPRVVRLEHFPDI